MAIVIEGVTGAGRQAMLDGLKALQSDHRAVVAESTTINVGDWVRVARPLGLLRSAEMDGRVARVTGEDRARGPAGAYTLACPRGAADIFVDARDVEPWVPRVGERVRQNVVTGDSVAGTVTDEAPVRVGVDVCVRWAHGFGSRAAVSYLMPVIDATGRPVVEPGHMVANPLSPAAQSVRDAFVNGPPLLTAPYTGTVNVTEKWRTTAAGDRMRVVVDGVPREGTVVSRGGVIVDVNGTTSLMLDGERAARGYAGAEPVRPTRAGQRVRCADGRVGRVEDLNVDVNGLHCVRVGPDVGIGLRTDEPTGTLVVLADATPEYVPRVGDRVRAKGRTGIVIDLVYGPDQETPTECVVTWEPPSVPGPVDLMPCWHRSAWPWLELLAPETRTLADAPPVEPPPPCGSATHATRPAGTTCVHWWPCGCAVEPDGEDALGHVDGSPRGVLVWGHGATGRGFTRDEAVSAWRESLAIVQTTCVGHGAAELRAGFDALTRSVRQDFAARKAQGMDAAKVDPGASEKNIEAIAHMCGSVSAFARFDYGEGVRLMAEGRALVPPAEAFPPRTGASTKRKRAGRRRSR